MAVIFTASSDAQSARHSSIFFEPFMHWMFPQMPQARIEELHYHFRKCCHMTEYAILAALAWRAIRNSRNISKPRWQWDEAGLALAVTFSYAASDELHQVFVPTRTGQISDVIFDVTGGIIGLTLIWFAGKTSRRC